jgi:hypothetical protein
MLPALQTHNIMGHLRPDHSYTPISAVSLVTPHSTIDPHNLRSALSPMSGVGAQPMNFPPPPGVRDRSASRSKGRFGLSALARGLSTDRSSSTAPSENAIPPPPREPSRSGMENPPPFMRRPTGAPSSNRSSVYIQPSAPIIQAPSSRRSASAGAPSPSQALPSNVNWNNGAVPPPPPIPSDLRSASTGPNNFTADGVPLLSMPTRRPRAAVSTLEPIPHTPAGWENQPESNGSTPVAVKPEENDSSERSFTSGSERISHGDGSSSSSGNFTRMQQRDSTVKGIRERRNETRAVKDRDQAPPDMESHDEMGPSHLKLNLSSPSISRHGAVKKSRSSMSPQESPGNLPMRVRRSTTAMAENVASPLSANLTPKIHSAPGSAGLTDSPNGPYPPARGISRSAGKAPIANLDAFASQSNDRHQEFIEKERSAASDQERLEIFAEYIVMESRIRRSRYSDTFTAMSAGDILDMTRDLWRKLDKIQLAALAAASSQATTPHQRPTSHRTESFGSHASSSPMSSRAQMTPRTESDSPQDLSIPPARDNTFRNYQPVLSPIPSMAMSTVPDPEEGGEEESRGRSKSRWWESDSGSIGNGGRKIERSKRESKYMGLHPDARFNLQYEDDNSPASIRAGPSSQYPPEKVGWHDEEPKPPASPMYYSVPNTPSATAGLDMSRLITLPPPYPRHYPAMSNSHPELASFRATIRTLNEISEVQEKRSAYDAKITRQRAVSAQEAAAREAQMHHNINEKVRLGQMGYAAAAAAEEQFRAQELQTKQDILRREFNSFTPEVQQPLNAMLAEKITKARACIAQLRDGLSDSDKPDAPMEEGDEHPELLEKLKLIKWLVEARETLHHTVFDLESERSAKFRAMILTELRDRNSPAAEIQDAEQFFHKDTTDRASKFEQSSRARIEELQVLVQKYVDRGVQDQLSAFWDIAPRLLEVLQRIPERYDMLKRLSVSVPHKEISENPSYGDFPLQYLYGLLCHAKKATYQFIENQVGLLCLAHEVGIVLMTAGIKVLKASRCAEENLAEDDSALEEEMQQMAKFEEQRLTRDLKERVSDVEGQWDQALGKNLGGCVKRVQRVLEDTGGWDEESLKD